MMSEDSVTDHKSCAGMYCIAIRFVGIDKQKIPFYLSGHTLIAVLCMSLPNQPFRPLNLWMDLYLDELFIFPHS